MTDDLAGMAAFAEARMAEDEARSERGNPNWRIFPQGSRALREVEAKRAILADHVPVRDLPGDPAFCAVCITDRHGYPEEWGDDPWPCATVRATISVYSDHPDYLPGWAPAAVGG